MKENINYENSENTVRKSYVRGLVRYIINNKTSSKTMKNVINDGESSVSYTGQVVRNVLIKDLKTLSSSGSAATDSATMTDLFRNGGASSANILNNTANSIATKQLKWSDFDKENKFSLVYAMAAIPYGLVKADQYYQKHKNPLG